MPDELKKQIEESAGRKIFADFLSKKFYGQELLPTFDKLTELYFEVNGMINISALRTADDVYIKHYLDSLYPFEYFVGDVCDVGCGGGFPSLPLAIATEHEVTGVDSVGKKLTLIRRAVTELGIKNLKAEHSRSEDLAKTHKYDTVCARALADVDKALMFCAPLAKDGGQIILYRTRNDEPAKKSIADKLGVDIKSSIDYELPNTDVKRRLFIYEKQK